MLGRDVERLEIVPVGLDVGPFGDRETHVGEDRDDLLGDLADRMDAPSGGGPARRQGDVEPSRSEARVERGRSQHGLRALERRRRPSRLSALSAAPAPCARSGGSAPSCFSSSVTLPFLPSAATRTPPARAGRAARGDRGRGASLRSRSRSVVVMP